MFGFNTANIAKVGRKCLTLQPGKETEADMITFDNSKIRRQDRLLTAEEAYTLLKEGEYGVLSMITPEGTPYGVPVNYVWDGDGAIYIHCASDGRKLNCIHGLQKHCVGLPCGNGSRRRRKMAGTAYDNTEILTTVCRHRRKIRRSVFSPHGSDKTCSRQHERQSKARAQGLKAKAADAPATGHTGIPSASVR